MKNKKMHSFGRISALNVFHDNVQVKDKTMNLTKEYGFTIVGQTEHAFTPHGLTFVILLAESHISVHTYPEDNYADIDCFTCGNQDPEQFLKDLAEKFCGVILDQQTFNRN